ncbi:TonB family protein [Oryzicola mucosus]|uniref:TonB family protein n=1 Tax=Oryzicola mucosus TaxID=2767425 RepID=A0A8J6PZZ4_9HYPH|nr:TonB family protein [Oryzicola mucosus]MBD0413825.1 TonB family protein [Oryzicola mucosus]
MKAGLTTSVVLHASLLAVGLVTMSAPSAMQVENIESFPVELVPLSEVPQSVLGERKAEKAEKPAPVPTQRPDVVADAQKVGNNSADTDAPITPEASPRPVEPSAAPPPAPEPKPQDRVADEAKPEPAKQPEPKPEPKPEPVEQPAPKPEPVPEPAPRPEPVKQPEPKPEPTPAPAQEAKPEPKQETTPDPVAETIAQEPAPTEAVQLPNSAPAPAARPDPAPAQQTAAKASETKPSTSQSSEQTAVRPKSDEKQFSTDEITALLNKAKPSGGGAKRSTEQAALGAKKTTGQTLSQSDKAALSSQLSDCWTIPVGGAETDNLKVSIRFKVTQAGKIDGRPTVETSSGNRPFDESAIRAVQKCDNQGLKLPPANGEWDQFVINFDPAEMF